MNAISPGVYASEMTFDAVMPEDVDKIGKGVLPVPAKRAGTCVSFPHLLISLFEPNYFSSGQEMGGTAVYLASRAGGYVNGQEIVIDGGYVAVNPSSG